jgi:hypothetical protein
VALPLGIGLGLHNADSSLESDHIILDRRLHPAPYDDSALWRETLLPSVLARHYLLFSSFSRSASAWTRSSRNLKCAVAALRRTLALAAAHLGRVQKPLLLSARSSASQTLHFMVMSLLQEIDVKVVVK